jgi:hypothetical protein
VASENLGDGLAVETVTQGKFLDRLASLVPGDQLGGLVERQPALNLSRGSKIDFWSAFRDNLEKVLEAFPLVTEVRITSQHLHSIFS